MSLDVHHYKTATQYLDAWSAWLGSRDRTESEVRDFIGATKEKVGGTIKLSPSGLGILRNHKGEILLLKRSANISFPNTYSFPGGQKDEGDSDLEYTTTRETMEETGLRTQIMGYHSTRFTNVPGRSETQHHQKHNKIISLGHLLYGSEAGDHQPKGKYSADSGYIIAR